MKAGTFIEIEYTGRIAETGEIFDLTDEKLAKEKHIYNPRTRYGPVTIIIGDNMILKGLEDKITTMKAGEEKKITLKPEDAFGPRNPELLKVFSQSYFTKQRVSPIPGQYITLGDSLSGKVLSVSAGRVRIDFNHPLAGKTLEYEVKLNRELSDPKDRISAMIESYTNLDKKDIRVQVKDKKATISFTNCDKLNDEQKKRVSDSIKEKVTEIADIEIKADTETTKKDSVPKTTKK